MSSFSTFARAGLSKGTTAIARSLLRIGLSPDAVTVIGTVASVAAAVTLFPTGHLLVGTLLIWFFVMFDMLDGAMARLRGGGTPFGAVLDATCDRVADGAVFASLAWWAFTLGDNKPLAGATLVCLIASQVTSYVKARAEASGFIAHAGLIERPERLIIVLVGSGLTGIGLTWSIHIAMWVLAVASVFTVAQRVLAVRNADGARDQTLA
ncbi:MAG: phosphatidylinositol phosphate synthase [Mycobacteriaceae bacterium]